MELRRYLVLIGRHVWLVLLVFVVATSATFWFVDHQVPMFESTGTYVAQPAPAEDGAVPSLDDINNSIDLLIRNEQIIATYAKIASSQSIRDEAIASIPSVDTSGTTVTAEPVTGTNILKITVGGPDPEAAQELARAVGDKTFDHVAGDGDPFVIQPLDDPEVPDAPSSPNKPLTIAVGTTFGLLFGIGLALLVEYLVPPKNDRGPNPLQRASATDDQAVDDPVTGLASERFLAERVIQEVSRAQHHGDLFSIGVLKVAIVDVEGGRSRLPDRGALFAIADALGASVRDEDVVARLGGTTFAALLPGMDVATAEWAVLEWEAVLAESSEGDEQEGPRLRVRTAVCEYRDEAFSGDRDAITLARRLVTRRAVSPPPASTPSPSGERAER